MSLQLETVLLKAPLDLFQILQRLIQRRSNLVVALRIRLFPQVVSPVLIIFGTAGAVGQHIEAVLMYQRSEAAVTRVAEVGGSSVAPAANVRVDQVERAGAAGRWRAVEAATS